MPLDVLAAIQNSGYLSPWKFILPIILLIIWVKLLAWIDKDAPDAHLPREIMNAGMFLGFLLGYGLFFLLSGTGATIGALVGFFIADIGTYLGVRAKVVGLKDLREQLSDWFNATFRKKSKEIKAVAGQVVFFDSNGVAQEPPDAESPDRLQYDSAQRFMTKPLQRGAERLDILAADTAIVRYTKDGMEYDGEALDRNAASAAIQFLKRVGGLDLNERRKPQTGAFKALIDGGKRLPVQITTQGSTAGEAAKIITDPKNRQNFKFDDVGFTEEQKDVFRKAIEEGGVVLLAAPKKQGLTSLAYAIIRAHDAFMFHIQTIERAPELDLEGVTQNALAANAPANEEAKQVSWVVSQEPDILMLTSIEDRNSATDLAKFAVEGKRVYVCVREGNVFEAISRWRKLVGDDNLAMKNLKMAIAGRIMRKLCDACKIGYTPDPTQLRKMNMNPDSTSKLYSQRKDPMRDAKGNIIPCNFCKDIGFNGRFGVYELFQVDDEVKKAILAGGSDQQLKQLFRKQRAKLIQEVALSKVQSGDTSVEEVLRVMKETSGPPQGAAPARKPPPAGGAPSPAARPAQPRPKPAAQ